MNTRQHLIDLFQTRHILWLSEPSKLQPIHTRSQGIWPYIPDTQETTEPFPLILFHPLAPHHLVNHIYF